jgi:hypothetical protein
LLVGTNFAAINYAQDAKPYSGDMFLAVLIPLLALAVASGNRARHWIVYALAITFAPLVSFPTILVSASTAGFLLVTHLLQRVERGWLLKWLVAHAAAAAFVLGYDLLFLRSQRDDWLDSYWSSGFAPEIGFPGIGQWLAHQLWWLIGWFFTPVPLWGAADLWLDTLVAALVGVGVVAIARGKRATYLLFLLGPLLLVMVCAILHLYPFDPHLGGRLLLFFLPSICILCAMGVGAIMTVFHSRVTPLRFIAPAIMLVPLMLAGRTAWDLRSGRELPSIPREEVRDLVESDLLPQLRADDAVYIYWGAVSAFDYYAPSFRDLTPPPPDYVYTTRERDGVEIIYGATHADAENEYTDELRSTLSQHRSERLWVLLSHIQTDREQSLTQFLEEHTTVEQIWRQPGATLYLVDNAPDA